MLVLNAAQREVLLQALRDAANYYDTEAAEVEKAALEPFPSTVRRSVAAVVVPQLRQRAQQARALATQLELADVPIRLKS